MGKKEGWDQTKTKNMTNLIKQNSSFANEPSHLILRGTRRMEERRRKRRKV